MNLRDSDYSTDIRLDMLDMCAVCTLDLIAFR